MYSLKSVSGETSFGRILLISCSAFLVTMLSSMFWVTGVSPRPKKIALVCFAVLGNPVPPACKALGLLTVAGQLRGARTDAGWLVVAGPVTEPGWTRCRRHWRGSSY